MYKDNPYKQEIWTCVLKNDPYTVIIVVIQERVIQFVTFSYKIIGSKKLSWYYRILHGTIESVKIISYDGNRIKTTDKNNPFKKYLISTKKVQVLRNLIFMKDT